MTRVYVADAKTEERSALRLLLLDLNMDVAGEAADWTATLNLAPHTSPDMLLVDWDLLPVHSEAQALAHLRTVCPNLVVVVLFSELVPGRQVALSVGADAFISKGDEPEMVVKQLILAAASIRI